MKTAVFDVKILANEKISPQHYILECELPEELPSAPGQFLELYLDREKQFLRRPFSIFEYNRNVIKILYKIKGQVTNYLAQLKKGAFINIIYPLGNSFFQPETSFPSLHSLWIHVYEPYLHWLLTRPYSEFCLYYNACLWSNQVWQLPRQPVLSISIISVRDKNR